MSIDLWFTECAYKEEVESVGRLDFFKGKTQVGEVCGGKNLVYVYFPPAFTDFGHNRISYKEILGIKINAYITYSSRWTMRCHIILAEWNFEDIATADQLPAISSSVTLFDIDDSDTAYNWAHVEFADETQINTILRNGICIQVQGHKLWTPYSDAGPRITLIEGNVIGLNVTQTYPVGNTSISKETANTFQWSAEPTSTNTYTPVEVASSTIRWRKYGESSYSEISTNGLKEHTFPAGTFENGEIEWQVVCTANSGAVTTTEWVRTLVSEPVSTPVIISPQNTVLDASKEILFQWEHVIENGTNQTAYELQTSPDQMQWEILSAETTAKTSVTIAANTFPSGILYWRVRTYNLNGIAGEWSDNARVIMLSAPPKPSVAVVSAEPQFTIRWNQTEQQAYEISLNGVTIAKKFSSQSDYTYPKYLMPGTYSVEVRIQNKYGYWSDWGMTNLTIKKSDLNPINIRVEANNHVASISWDSLDVFDKFIVYRNDIKIGETSDHFFIDQFAAGHASYFVRGIFTNSGRCQTSETMSIFISVSNLMIAEIKNPKWINLKTSTSSLRTTKAALSRNITYGYFLGSLFPGADIGENQSNRITLECAWPNSDLQIANDFETLLGKVVVLKTPAGKAITAVLESMQPETNKFWTSYVAQLTQIDTEEEPV